MDLTPSSYPFDIQNNSQESEAWMIEIEPSCVAEFETISKQRVAERTLTAVSHLAEGLPIYGVYGTGCNLHRFVTDTKHLWTCLNNAEVHISHC